MSNLHKFSLKTVKEVVCLCLFFGSASNALAESLLLENGTVFPGDGKQPMESVSILIKDQHIVDVSSNSGIAASKIVDLSGKFVTAGFWNSHVHHLFNLDDTRPENAAQLENKLNEMFISKGFTSVIDTGAHPAVLFPIIKAISGRRVVGPDVYAMGGSLVPQNGSPFYIEPVQLPETWSPQQAADLSAEVLDMGYHGIKIFTGSWATPTTLKYMPAAHAASVVKTAHNLKKLVFAHPSDSDGARIAVEAGVDALAHTFPAELKGPWDRSLPQQMVDQNVALVPTLMLWRYDLPRIGLPAELVDRLENNALEQLSVFQSMGGRVLFGTDVGYMRDPSTFREFQLMERAGLDFSDVLASLTTAPAAMLGLSKTHGKPGIGYVADLVVLNNDPREGATAFSDVQMVIKNGEIVFQNTD
ncbi:MAG: amidohydrolase family protein [Pseudomonadota bacterium]